MADLQVATSGKLISVFGFDAGYRSANILEPGRGYWVNMTAAGVLNFGGEWSQDCNGVWGGDSVADACGACDADPANDCCSVVTENTCEDVLGQDAPSVPVLALGSSLEFEGALNDAGTFIWFGFSSFFAYNARMYSSASAQLFS